MAGVGAPSLGYLLAWTAAVYGVVLIVTGSKLMEPLRRLTKQLWPFLGYLLSCPMCFGFWVGAAVDLAGLPLLMSRGSVSLPVSVVLSGTASSALSWGCHVTLARLGAEDL